jgi:hypothetical protein
MAMTFQVAGEAKVQIKLSSSFADLGISMDGVTISVEQMYEDIFIDTFGPKVPFQVQSFLGEARVKAKLLFWDETVMETIRNGNGITEGLVGQAGALVFGTLDFAVKILAPAGGAGGVWDFPHCYLTGAQDLKVGTRRGELDLTWRAIPYTGVSGATTAAVLFTHT